jgi:hypothetical protein
MSIQFCQYPQLLPFSWLAISRPKAFLRKARSRYIHHAHCSPKPMSIGHRQRVCPRKPGTRHLFARQQIAVINSI